MLDIIMPHYNEEWARGKKFFDMFAIQRQINFKDVQVILVHDGAEYAFPDELFKTFPYKVRQISIPHAGVSAARNAGLKESKAEWVMFCDFDDMFAHPFALKNILALLPAKKHDMLYGDLIAEGRMRDGSMAVTTKTDFNSVLVHAKLFRRKFLLKNNLWFNTELYFCEDSEMISILCAIVDPNRVGKIIAPLPLYIWCFDEKSVSRSQILDNNEVMDAGAKICCHIRNKNVCAAYAKVNKPERYSYVVARAIWDSYFFLNVRSEDDRLNWMRRDFAKWYVQHEDVYSRLDQKYFPEIQRGATIENKRPDFIEGVSFDEWLNKLLNEYSE